MKRDKNMLFKCLAIFIVFCLISLAGAAQQRSSVTGTVINQNGEILAGVTVKLRDSAANDVNQVTTDDKGIFVVNNLLAGSTYSFSFSHVGYDPYTNRKYLVKPAENSLFIVKLKEAASNLNEVVVVGYGKQRKIDITGAVSQVSGEEIAKQVSPNPISGLQGKVAGVQITNDGQPGNPPSIRIRGLGTAFGNPNPLYVVDGVWFDDVSFLNSNDIESISILKDASSQSLYGIKAANGVVLITTKSGKLNQKPVINVNSTLGFQHATNPVKMSSAKEYAILTNEYTGAQTLDPNAYGQGTDWYKEILRTAVISNSQVSVSGGGEKSTYNFSVGYLKQQGLLQKNDYSRVTAHLQNDFIVKEGLKIGYSIVAAQFLAHDPASNIFYQAYVAPPNFSPKNPDGTYGDPVKFGNFLNPRASLDFFTKKTRGMYFNGSVYADLKITKHLSFHTSFGGQYGDSSIQYYIPAAKFTTQQFNAVSSLTLTKNEIRNWIVENTFRFEQTFQQHHITVLMGQTAQSSRYYSLVATSINVPNENESSWYLNLGDQGTRNVTDVGDLFTVSSYFGRLNYSYNDRYLLTLSMRADGSSKFSNDQKWGYFPSVGAAWILSQESFMKNQRIFDVLKIRGSWGLTGNASVPSNLSVLTADNSPYFISFIGGVPHTGQGINSVVPPALYWERGEGTDIGLEMALLRNKLTIETDFYNRKTKKAIFSVPILGNVGSNTSALIANNADFQNQGFELAIGWKSNIGRDISFSINANAAVNNNKVLSVATGSIPFYSGGLSVGGFTTTRTVTGRPIGEFFGLKTVGVFQNQGETDKSAQAGSASPGDFKYLDVNKDGAIDQKDWVVLGNPNPKYVYGLNTYFQYRQLDFLADFQGVAKVDIYDAIQGVRYGNESYTHDFYANRWHGPGTSNNYPKSLTGNNLQPSSFFVQSGDYFRIRNLQLGYTFSNYIITKWKLQRIRVFVNAQNPLTLFKYKGFTPEVGGKPTNAGIDYNTYPLSAIYNFGVNVSF